MKSSDLIAMCLSNLTRRKVRTSLTIMGVVVGTCAIMVMISLGVAMKVNQEEMLAQMGDLTVIQVYNYNRSADSTVLDDAAVAKIQVMDGVKVATPFYQPWDISMRLYAGKNDRYEMYLYSMVGVYPEALEEFGYELKEGRYVTAEDKPFTVVVGEYTAYSFRDTRKRGGNDMVWPEPDMNGEIKKPFVNLNKDELTLRTDELKEGGKQLEFNPVVVGTLKEDWSKGYETREGIFVSIYDLKNLVAQYNKINNIKTTDNNKGYENVKVKVTDISKVAAVEEQIQAMGFETWSMESIRKPMEEQARQQQLILGGLGAISLFVAALGITNTMIMSIYERTREIGVMKVLGCVLGNIRTVFLMEAGLIGFIGGVVGIIISYGISFGLNYISMVGMGGGENYGFSMGGLFGGMGGTGSKISIIPPWLVALSLVFATLIGLISGFGPANRAVKISALEAIKHE